MSEKLKVRDSKAPHFITITTVDWVDVFTRIHHKDIVINSLKYCQRHKGLKIYAWIIMTNHLHMIVSSDDKELPAIMRDFKTFTSKKLFEAINSYRESRRNWIRRKFIDEGKRNARSNIHKFWKDGFHPLEIRTEESMKRVLNYIHQNPVKAGFVKDPEHFWYSSAIDYSGGKGMLDIELAL